MTKINIGHTLTAKDVELEIAAAKTENEDGSVNAEEIKLNQGEYLPSPEQQAVCEELRHLWDDVVNAKAQLEQQLVALAHTDNLLGMMETKGRMYALARVQETLQNRLMLHSSR